MIRGLDDVNKKPDKGNKDKQHFTGNQKSGQVVEDPNDDIDQIVKKAEKQKPGPSAERTSITITLYQNGFMIDKGPFRPYEDPANKQFMEEIKTGVVPTEIRQQYPNGCAVGLDDKRGEAFRPPTPPMQTFVGSGVTLGQQVQAQALGVNLNAGEIIVDESKPKTQIQLRLHNGKTVTVDINASDRVQTLYQYVQRIAPVNGQFQLIAGFPPTPLENKQATIQEADLLDSRVTQKLI